MSIHFRYTRSIGLATIGILVTSLWLRARQIHQEEQRPFGRFTAMQIIALSAPICRGIAPGAGELLFSAHAYHADHLWWTVVCQDRSGRELASLDWIPQTGELYEIGALSYDPKERRAAPLAATEAASRMRRWLSLLRPDVSTGWRLSGEPIVDNNPDRNWAARWVHQDVRCFIKIDGHSGALLLARFGHSKKIQ